MQRPALRPFALALLLAVAMLLALACGEAGDPTGAGAPPGAPPASQRNDGAHDVAVLELGELGEIHIELLPELAPLTVEHFLARARAGDYDGTSFHRVIPGFLIQGGSPWTLDDDPRNDAMNNGGTPVPDEFSDFPHVRGTVSLANLGRPDSGKVQFFIIHRDRPELDGRYAAFGRVVRGMAVVDAITELEIDTFGRYGPTDRPYPLDARIERVRIVPAGSPIAGSTESDGSADGAHKGRESLDPFGANG